MERASRINKSGTRVSRFKGLAISVLSLVALVSVWTIPQAQGSISTNKALAQGASETGAAFAMTNATADNRIINYSRAADGALKKVGSISTRGNGIGVDLDTQGGLTSVATIASCMQSTRAVTKSRSFPWTERT